MNEKRKIPIALATDDNYAPYCATTMASILINSRKESEINFYILEDKLSKINKSKLLELKKIKKCSINFVHIEAKDIFFKNLPVHFHFSIETYYRLKLASLLPQLDQIIYLDCDMIVLDDLSELLDVDIDDFYAGMVLSDYEKKSHLMRLGLPKETPYFNGGFALFNLKKWREDGLEEKFFAWARDNREKILLVDQDVMNVVFKDFVRILPSKYNIQLHHYDNKIIGNIKELKLKEDPIIIHYSGPQKPWNNKNMLLAEYFWKYAKYVEETFLFNENMRHDRHKKILILVLENGGEAKHLKSAYSVAQKLLKKNKKNIVTIISNQKPDSLVKENKIFFRKITEGKVIKNKGFNLDINFVHEVGEVIKQLEPDILIFENFFSGAVLGLKIKNMNKISKILHVTEGFREGIKDLLSSSLIRYFECVVVQESDNEKNKPLVQAANILLKKEKFLAGDFEKYLEKNN